MDSHRNKQNRRTAKALFAQIKTDGYVGGYSQLTAFIRDWRGKEGKAPHAFVPLKFDLGEAFQFDWSEEGLVIGGIYRRMQVSHLKLCASRAFWLVAYTRKDGTYVQGHTKSSPDEYRYNNKGSQTYGGSQRDEYGLGLQAFEFQVLEMRLVVPVKLLGGHRLHAGLSSRNSAESTPRY